VKQVNKIQSDWLNKNFALSKRDFPNEFISPKEMIEYLIGNNCFRGIEYHFSDAQGTSFIEDCWCSINANIENSEKFNKILLQFNYLMNECERLEFYELLHNFNNMIKCFEVVAKWHNESVAEEKVNFLLGQIGIKTINP
jgi:hypothetical protein